jgi:hypothetical protein
MFFAVYHEITFAGWAQKSLQELIPVTNLFVIETHKRYFLERNRIV